MNYPECHKCGSSTCNGGCLSVKTVADKCYDLAVEVLEDSNPSDKNYEQLGKVIHNAINEFRSQSKCRNEERESQWDDANIREDARESA